MVQTNWGERTSCFFNDERKAFQKKHTELLLTHINPYTKLRYADDPVIATLCLINEGTVFWDYQLQDKYAQELSQKWNTWLLNKYKSRNSLASAWTIDESRLAVGEDPAAGSVKRPLVGSQPTRRRADYLRFLYELESGYFTEMRAFIRGLGVKVPITGSNHWEQSAIDFAANSKADFLDRHAYWDHPQGGYGEAVNFENIPMVISPDNMITGLTRLETKGIPFTVSEWACAWPNEYRAEGLLIMAPYAQFHDWDAILQFGWGGTDWDKYMDDNFELNQHPEILAQWPAVALMFHRHDVKTGQPLGDKARILPISMGR